MRPTRTILAVAALAGALTLAAPTANAAENPCGYFERGPYALYNNCGSTNQLIQIDLVADPDETQCVGLGVTMLADGADRTVSAWSIGTC
ncbi:hypothetical protein JOF56_007485 [Kibdelosporangium banguiense]|uniref:Alpha amylase inhibitor n=1 Tax=Kibdelosporangium banguiense TaxID=1365924 RepID=A0ABS4TRQ4_9PSEU|nr:DUF6355 family natural product biosynthesis protein [Kibdelosporangium banguiense]MBP2327100.1 hypothetical protein [Kibdelosporangium banguiense]